MVSTAQAAIVVTGRPNVSKYWLQDGSIVTAFIWLAATDLEPGLGSTMRRRDQKSRGTVKRT